ncbi:MAG: hypothetical protein R2774_06550 [Saprospiraceae bacterium]
MNKSDINQAIQNGYSFKLWTYISRSLDTFQKIPLLYIGYTFIFLFTHIFSGLVPFVSILIGIVISYPLIMGYYLGTNLFLEHKSKELGNFFKGFDYVGPLALLYLVTLMITLVPFIIFGYFVLQRYLSGDYFLEDFMSLISEALFSTKGALIVFSFLLLEMYLYLTTRWAPLLIVFYNYKPLDALITSFKMVNKNFFPHLLYILVIIVLSFIGIAAFIIGLVVTMPLIFIIDYFAFADVTNLENRQSEIDELGREVS